MVKYFYAPEKRNVMDYMGRGEYYDNPHKAAESGIADVGSDEIIYVYKVDIELVKIARNTLILEDIKKK